MKKNNIMQAQKTASALPQLQPNLRQRILVAEDDPDIRRLNTELLACSGYEVDAAEDGAAAWDALQRDNYDLLITDHDMPKVTGVELLQKLHDSNLKLPVIMATGTLPEAQLARHPWLEIKAVLLKPYTFDDLLDTVKHVLHMDAGDRQQMAPPPNWQDQPLPNGLRL
jgi:DNA-binding NtrC family response regulator